MLSSLTKSAAQAKLKGRRGLTLIEAAMVLVILALVVGGVMLYYSSASTSRRVSQVAGQIGTVQQAVRAAFAGQANYTNLDASLIVNQMPTSMVQGTTLVHAFNGPLTVAPANINGITGFSVTLGSIPQDACAKLAAMDFGRANLAVAVNGNTLTPPVTAAAAQGACSATNGQMAWTFQ